jgi:hypothetical protein
MGSIPEQRAHFAVHVTAPAGGEVRDAPPTPPAQSDEPVKQIGLRRR